MHTSTFDPDNVVALDNLLLMSYANLSSILVSAMYASPPVTDSPPPCLPMLAYMNAIQNDLTQIHIVRYMFTGCYALLFLIGLPLNVLVVKRYVTDRSMRQRAGVTFLLNLMVADMVLCCTSLWATPIYHFTGHWMLGAWACKALPAAQAISIAAVAWSLTVLVVDKCLHITDFTRAPTSAARAALISTCIWTLGGLTIVPVVHVTGLISGSKYPVTGRSGICGDHCAEQWPSLHLQKAYSLTAMLVLVVMPLCIMSACYYLILRTINADLLTGNMPLVTTKASISNASQSARRKRKAYFMSMGVVGSFMMCWIPLLLRNLALDFGFFPAWLFQYESFLSLSIHLLAMCSVLTNPLFVYWLTVGSNKSQSRPTNPLHLRTRKHPLVPHYCQNTRHPQYRNHDHSPVSPNPKCLGGSCSVLNMTLSTRTSLHSSAAPTPDEEQQNRSYGSMQMMTFKEYLEAGTTRKLANHRSNSTDQLQSSSENETSTSLAPESSSKGTESVEWEIR